MGSNRSDCCYLDETKINAFLEDYYVDFVKVGKKGFEAWCEFFGQYRSPDYLLIRPSGNPVDSVGMAHMLSTDTMIVDVKLVSIDYISIMETRRSAVVVYTADQIFSYKGDPNEDRVVVSCVMEYRGDEIKIIHEHRTNGTPIPRESRWSPVELISNKE